MTPAELIPVLIFVAVALGLTALASLVTPARDRVAERVQAMSGTGDRKPDAGAVGRAVRDVVARVATQLLPAGGRRRERLRLRLTQAGYTSPQGVFLFQAARAALVLGLLVAVAAVVAAGLLTPRTGVAVAALVSAVGVIAPGVWLDAGKASRQNELRRGLPDFFDVLVLCIEGGMSLPAAWRRVTDELRQAYPTLWHELKTVEQEAEIGRSMGEALNRLAERTDLEEVQSLASVVGQAERLGTELARPLRTLSDALRLRRIQKAEETAHKTATKIMFPTLLFIFPGVFAIILGPMIVQVMNIFSGGGQ